MRRRTCSKEKYFFRVVRVRVREDDEIRVARV